MVYNYKYKMEWVGLKFANYKLQNPSADDIYYRLEFYKQEPTAITYTVQTLQATTAPFSLNYKSASSYVFEPLRSSFAEINIMLDSLSTIDPSEFYSDNSDISFKVKLKLINDTSVAETDLWQGYVLNDDIQFDWQSTYTLRMSSIDNLSILKKYKYSDPSKFSMYIDTDVYTGISVKDFIVRCLSYSGNELNVKFDIRKKYGDPASNVDETSIFLNQYSAIDWKTKSPRDIYKLLTDVLQAFGCILYQDNRDNTWTILTVNSLGTTTGDIIPMKKYSSVGTFIADINYDISGTIASGTDFVWSDINQIVTLRPSLNTVRMEFEYQRKNLLNNYGFFKDTLSATSATDWDIIGTFPISIEYNQFAQYDKNKVYFNSSNYTQSFTDYLRGQFQIDSSQLPDALTPNSYQLYMQFDYDASIKQSTGNYIMVSFGELDFSGNFNFIRDEGSWITGTSPYATTYIGVVPYGGTELDLDEFRALSKLKRGNPTHFYVYLRPIVQTFPAASVYAQFDNFQLNYVPINMQYAEKIFYTTYNFGDDRLVGERNIKNIKNIQFHGGWRESDVLTYEDAVMIKNIDNVLNTGRKWYRTWETDGSELFYSFTHGTTASILSFYRGVGRIFTGNVYAEQTPITEVTSVPFGFPMYVSIEGTTNTEIVSEVEVAFESRVLADGGTIEDTTCSSDFLREFYEVNAYFMLNEATFDYYTNKTFCTLHENFTNTNETFSNDYGIIRGNSGGVGEIGSTTNNTQTDEIPE